MNRLALLLLAVALLALAGCGGDDGGGGSGDESATELLDRGFATDVDTGELEMKAELELEGGGLLNGKLDLSVEGAFRTAGGPTEWPDLDMEFDAGGAGRNYSGRVITTRENAWIEYGGETYEAGEELWARTLEALQQQSAGEPQTFADAGVDPLDWVEDAEADGTKVTGRLEVERMLRDLASLGATGESIPEDALDQVGEVIENPEFEVTIGEDDIWRRISFTTDFTVPEEDQASTNGLEGGSLSVEMELSSPNEPVEIEGPASARPIEELMRSLGIPPELFLGPGFAQPTPG